MSNQPASIRDAQHEGLNFFGVAVLAVLGLSLIHGLQMGPTWRARLDDLGLGALVLASVSWYLSGRHRYERTLWPLGALLVAAALKVGGIWLTYGRFVPAGADFGVAIFLGAAALIFGGRYVRLRDRAPGDPTSTR